MITFIALLPMEYTDMKKSIAIAAIGLMLAACGHYRVLRVEVLQPAALEPVGESFLFVDRGVVHEGDTLQAAELRAALGVDRAELLDCLYDGLRGGLSWGGKEVERATMPRAIVADSCLPPPMTPAEVDSAAGEKSAARLVTADYCRFRRVGREVDLEGNVLLRVYDLSTGALLDSLLSDRLQADVEIAGEDYRGTIREFFYQKGWSLAEYLCPTWVPTERRIYLGRPLLDVGNYFLERGDDARAAEIWTAALKRGRGVATRAAVNMAWLLERDGDFEEAIALLEQALERNAGPRAYIRERLQSLRQRLEDSDKLMNQLNE